MRLNDKRNSVINPARVVFAYVESDEYTYLVFSGGSPSCYWLEYECATDAHDDLLRIDAAIEELNGGEK